MLAQSSRQRAEIYHAVVQGTDYWPPFIEGNSSLIIVIAAGPTSTTKMAGKMKITDTGTSRPAADSACKCVVIRPETVLCLDLPPRRPAEHGGRVGQGDLPDVGRMQMSRNTSSATAMPPAGSSAPAERRARFGGDLALQLLNDRLEQARLSA